MEINGKIIELLPEKSGESAKGPWRKQEYILETEGCLTSAPMEQTSRIS
jgi:hypothetical protein